MPKTTDFTPIQRYLAEFLGTFFLLFVGCGAIMSNFVLDGQLGNVGISLAFGMVIAVMIFIVGGISAAHFNPAVTIAFAVTKRFPWRRVLPYIIVQMVGALLAGCCHYLMFSADILEQSKFGAPLPQLNIASSLMVEFIISFLLMLVISRVATDSRVPGTVPALAIGMTVTLCALFAGPLTSAAMNPARSIAPAILSGNIASWEFPFIYILIPVLGAAAGAFCSEYLRKNQEHAIAAPQGFH